MAQGPINRPKDGIAALSGIIETDWAPYTFTMNWLFTQPEVDVHFEKGEPFCHIFPVQRGQLASVEPEIRALSSEPELEQQYQAWNESRLKFNTELQPTRLAGAGRTLAEDVLSRAVAGRTACCDRGSHHAAAAAAVHVDLTRRPSVTFGPNRPNG